MPLFHSEPTHQIFYVVKEIAYTVFQRRGIRIFDEAFDVHVPGPKGSLPEV